MTRNALVALATLLLVACTGASSPGANATQVASTVPSTRRPATAADTSPHVAPVESLADFAKRIRVECTPKGREIACIGGKPENGDIYDVELRPDCGADGFFGGVADDSGAELRDALAPNDEATLAVLSKGQLVCIQAIARAGQQPDYFFVSTIQRSAVPSCRGNRLCDMYGDRRVDLRSTPRECPVTRDTSCVAGWVDADALESFDNGM
ncbi:hypothetical protein [Lysobacter xanthus]